MSGATSETPVSARPLAKDNEVRAAMQSYACYIHLRGANMPHLRYLHSEDRTALLSSVNALMREWPAYEKIDVRDSEGDVIACYVKPLRDGLLNRH